jgi:hypothetical protein
MEHRASVEEIWEAAQHDRDAKKIAHEVYGHTLLADLNRCLAELTGEAASQPHSGECVWLRPASV